MTEPQLAGLAPRAALRAVRAQLEAAGVPDADFDARELYRLAAGRDPRLDAAPLPAGTAARLAALTARRCAREPLQYIAGQWDFLDFTLAVGPGVLCPRADSEIVCETALELLRAAARPDPAVLDLCAGTGCLGLGVKRFYPGARVTCVENSPAALGYLYRNAAGALPGAGYKKGRLVRFGYARITAETSGLLLEAGQTAPIHEFHHWDSTACGTDFTARKPVSGRSWGCGFSCPGLYAAFGHLYMAGTPGMAARFVNAARQWAGIL